MVDSGNAIRTSSGFLLLGLLRFKQFVLVVWPRGASVPVGIRHADAVPVAKHPVPVRIGSTQWFVLNIGIEIEALRVVEVGIWDWLWTCCPIWGCKPAQSTAVASGPEIIERRFGISFFAGELLINVG